jgi:hypothetical protein
MIFNNYSLSSNNLVILFELLCKFEQDDKCVEKYQGLRV